MYSTPWRTVRHHAREEWRRGDRYGVEARRRLFRFQLMGAGWAAPVGTRHEDVEGGHALRDQQFEHIACGLLRRERVRSAETRARAILGLDGRVAESLAASRSTAGGLTATLGTGATVESGDAPRTNTARTQQSWSAIYGAVAGERTEVGRIGAEGGGSIDPCRSCWTGSTADATPRAVARSRALLAGATVCGAEA